MKSLAISLYHASGKAYRLLAKLFILPSKSSLKNYISRLPTEAGISQETLNTIKQKVTHMSDMDKFAHFAWMKCLSKLIYYTVFQRTKLLV